MTPGRGGASLCDVMGTEFAAVLGDVVESRRHHDRQALQDQLVAGLEMVNARVPADQPFLMTIGDEFQALYRDLGRALEATLVLRLGLVGSLDVRFGIGWGVVEIRDVAAEPFRQDGPAWWAARGAIDWVGDAMDRRKMPRGLRTRFIDGSPDHPDPTRQSLVNAMLACRDEIVGRMDERSARLTLADLEGASIAEAARAEGITRAAAYERLQRSGAYALRLADDLLGHAVPT